MTIVELANGLRNGMFADRDNLQDAYNYVDELAKHSENPMAIWTAVMVVVNTIAKTIEEIEEKK